MEVVCINRATHRITTPFEYGGVVYLYLLKGDRIALIDTGTVSSPRAVLRPALAEIGLNLSDVDLILNTHAHRDHSGGNFEVKQVSNSSIHVHSADLPKARSTDAIVEAMLVPLRAMDVPAALQQRRIQETVACCGTAAGADVVLSDGDTVDLGAGIVLRVIHTPGHTPGSVCFYWESEGVLFTGDGVQGLGARAGTYPLYYDAASYRQSQGSLARLDLRLLCMGHGYLGGDGINSPTREGADGKAVVEESARVADTIHRAVAATVKKMPSASKLEIARSAISELVYRLPTLLVRETGLPKSVPTLHAHIEAALAGTYPE